jgi:hypothetical protein
MTEHRDRAAGFAITAAMRGRSTLGPGTALVDEDLFRLLLLGAPSSEKSLQVKYDAIKGVATNGSSITISVQDGRDLTLTTAEATLLRARVLAACRALPEVTRALRALGSRRASRGTRRNPTDKEGRFFSPLIAARRASMDARDATSVVAAFDAKRLTREMTATIVDFAAAGGTGHPARRRALEADLSDVSEQLSVALAELDELGQQALSDVDDLTRWRSWAAAVQRVFEAADRSWAAIEPIVNL